MSRDQRQVDKIREQMALLTKWIADPARSYETVLKLDERRQALQRALVILEKKCNRR